VRAARMRALPPPGAHCPRTREPVESFLISGAPSDGAFGLGEPNLLRKEMPARSTAAITRRASEYGQDVESTHTGLC